MTSAGDASRAAKALSRLGASKGGRARAEKLSPEERRRIGRRAATVRWVQAESTRPLIVPGSGNWGKMPSRDRPGGPTAVGYLYLPTDAVPTDAQCAELRERAAAVYCTEHARGVEIERAADAVFVVAKPCCAALEREVDLVFGIDESHDSTT